MQQIVVPPSPNWYGSHTADWAPALGLYAYGAQNSIVLLNTRAQTVRTLLFGHMGRVTAVAFAGAALGSRPSSAAAGAEPLPPLLVSSAADRAVRLWNVGTMQRVRALYKRPAEVTALAVTSDGRTVLLGDKTGSLFCWGLSDPESKPRKLGGCRHSAAVLSLAAAPQHSAACPTGALGSGGGLVLAGYADGSVLLLDWQRDRVVGRTERHSREVQCVRWFATPDPEAAAAAAAAQAAAREAAAAAREAASSAAAAAAAEGLAGGGSAVGSCPAPPAPAEGTEPASGEEGEPPCNPVPSQSSGHEVEPGSQAPVNGTSPGYAAAAGLTAEASATLQAHDTAARASPRAAAEAAAAAAAAAEAAAEAAAARLAAAPPAWEVLLSAGADGTLFLYSVAPGSLQPALQATLRLPRPHAGLTTSQSSRLWFAAAVVPPPPAVAPVERPAGDLSATGKPAAEPQQQQVWLVTTGHGGGLLGWRVPLQAGPPAGSRGPQNIAPIRLPVSHGRSVFTLHALAAAAPPSANAAAPHSAGGGSIGGTGGQLAEQLAEPQLLLLTSSMDRCLFLTRLPHPAVAAAAALAETTEGSWRRESAAGAAGEAAWRQARVDWRLTGLGAHVYGLSLLLPSGRQDSPAEATQQGQGAAAEANASGELPPPPPPPPETAEPQHVEQGGQAEQAKQAEHLLLAVGCGDKTIRVLPLPPTSAGGEVSTGQQKQLVLWQGISEKVTAVAWQPLLPEAAAGAGFAAVEPTAAALPAAAIASADASGDAVEPAAAAPANLPAAEAAPAAAAAEADTQAAAAAAVLAYGCEDGALGLMLPSREQALPLPVRHKAAVVDLRWALAGPSAAALQLYSLSADGTLLLWGPLPQPLPDLFPASKGHRPPGGDASGSWAPPASKLAAALGGPLDVGAQLVAVAAAAAAAGAGPAAAAAACIGAAQPTVTAVAVADLPTGSRLPVQASMAAAGAPGCHLLAVATQRGAVVVLRVAPQMAGPAAATSLELLWAAAGSGSPVSQLCFSTDGQRLAVAAESGLVAVHPWAAQAGLLGTQPGAAASTAGPSGLSCMLSSAVTALAWVDGGAGSPEGCGSGGLLAAALLAGGIQLLSVDAAGSGGGGGAGGIAPTAVLRGHSGIIRSLLWLPPRLELVQPAAEPQQSAPGAAPAASAPEQQGLAEGAVASPEGQARGDQSQSEATETAAAAERADSPAPLSELRLKLLLLSGGEDASVRLFDVNRQLAAWQQRQQAAAAEAAAAAVAAPAAAPAQVGRAGALAGKGEAGLGSAATKAAAAGTEAPGGSGPPTSTVLVEPQQADAAEGAIEVPPPPPPAPQHQSMSGTCSSPTTGAAVVAAVPHAVAQALPAAAPSTLPAEHTSTAAAAAAAAAPAAQQAASRAAAGTGPAGGSKKKAVASLLGDRGILQPSRVAEDDPRQQQAAQQACLQLAQQLLVEQARQAAANEASTVGPPPPPPPPPCTPPTALLLDCAVDPLSASLALQQHSEGLAAAATSAPSSASRLALAQRAAAAALLRGDVGAAMRVLLEHDALSADFVSLSAAAGPAAWRAVTQAYAAKLEQQGEPSLASLHLLAAGRAEEAVQVYQRAGLLREAVALATARLLPGHPLLQELHAAYAEQLSSKAQHEAAAAHLLAARQWAAAAAALCSRGTALSAAAAVQLCRQALSHAGAELSAADESRLRQQLGAAERQLLGLAAAEGVDPGAALAAVALPLQPLQVQHPHEHQQVQGGLEEERGAARPPQRHRYSAQQMLAPGGGVPVAPPHGLPADYAASAAAGGAPSCSQGPADAAAAPRDVASGSSGPRRRYTLQSLLQLSASTSHAGQQLRQAIPSELQSDST
ncbi:hypothetical protein ABPG77_006391 [Micractinium sp. CCAP 211/92]